LDFPPLGLNPPVLSSVNFSNAGGISSNYNLTVGPPVAPATNPPVITSSTSLYTLPPNQVVAQIHEAQIQLQYQLANHFVWDLGYVGTRSRHLLATRDLGSNGNGLGFVVAPGGGYIGQDILYDNRASASYNALQTSLQRTYLNGLRFLLSYTWSHGIDDSTGVFNGIGETRGQSGGPIDPFNFALDRGNSSLDYRHVFVGSAVWDLPVGKSRSHGSSMGNVADKMFGEWELSVIQTLQSGQHFDVGAGTNVGFSRADLIASNPQVGGANKDQYLNPADFAPPALTLTNLAGNTFPVGTLARNFFTGPARINTDLSLFKTTAITERFKAQLRIEFFNAWNSVNRLVPNNNIGDATFGQFFSAYSPRTVQYSLKVIF